MNKNSSQSGFGVVEMILILAVFVMVGLTTWRVFEMNREMSRAAINEPTVVKTIPKDWKKYENKELGFSFAYPEKWGEVKAVNGPAPYEGGHHLLTFTNFDQFKVAAQTADHRYTGPGMDVSPINGFTDFSAKYQDILKHEQRIDSRNGEILKKTHSYIAYTYADASRDTIVTTGIAKTKKLPGLEFGLTTDLAQFKLTDDVKAKLYSGEISPKQYQTWSQLDMVILFAKNVKSL